jgi:hypothetical protein
MRNGRDDGRSGEGAIDTGALQHREAVFYLVQAVAQIDPADQQYDQQNHQ